jgi:hypothetical protein
LEKLGVDGRIMDITEKGVQGVDWIYLAEDRVHCPALENKETNFCVL